MSSRPPPRPDDARRMQLVDAGLTALLLLQGVTLFVVIPLAGRGPGALLLLDLCHLAFAAICIAVLTQARAMRMLLGTSLAMLVAGPLVAGRISVRLALSAAQGHELIALIAFAFNATVTALVARHVFAGGRVTAHRVRGAVLLYLNVGALFAILYGGLAMHDPGAFSTVTGAVAGAVPAAGGGNPVFTYFSLATITTTGYGDIVPLHPLARSLANLEAVFGQLFPATLLSRLVALHLAHERHGGRD